MAMKTKEGRIIIDLYCKPKNGPQYLHYNSCQADHRKRLIIFSQNLQLKGICSEKNNLFKICFRKRDILTILSRKRLKKGP